MVSNTSNFYNICRYHKTEETNFVDDSVHEKLITFIKDNVARIKQEELFIKGRTIVLAFVEIPGSKPGARSLGMRPFSYNSASALKVNMDDIFEQAMDQFPDLDLWSNPLALIYLTISGALRPYQETVEQYRPDSMQDLSDTDDAAAAISSCFINPDYVVILLSREDVEDNKSCVKLKALWAE